MSKENIVIDFLLDAVSSKVLKPGDKIPSEYDLAEKFSISKLTANKAVGKLVERGVLRRLVGRGGTCVATPLAHRHNRGLIACRMQLLSAGTFVARMLKGASLAAENRCYTLGYFEYESDQYDAIIKSGARGILGCSSEPPPNDFPIPALEIGGRLWNNHVQCDDYSGAKELVAMLLRNGHRSIAVVSPYNTRCYRDRLDGFMDALTDSKMAGCRNRIFYFSNAGSFNPDRIYNEIMNRLPDCTAAMCVSDSDAYLLIYYLEQHGIPVPNKFSVTGFAGMHEIQNLRAITSVNQFPDEIGFAGCSRLIDLIEGKITAPVHELMPPELIHGSSIGRVSG